MKCRQLQANGIKKGYLITSKDRIQKEVRFNSQKNRGYAIKNEIVKELGFDFSNSHNPYN